MLEVSKDISFCDFENKFSEFVRFSYFLTDINSRGINLKFSHKIKQNLKGVEQNEKWTE